MTEKLAHPEMLKRGQRHCRCGCNHATGGTWFNGDDGTYLYGWVTEMFGSVADFADAVEKLGYLSPHRRT